MRLTMITWWNQPRSLLKPLDSMSFGWSGTGREKVTGAKTELKMQPLSRVECDEGTYPAQTLERFRHEVWMGKKLITD